MMFLIRTAFWLMVLVLVLPTDAQQQSQVFGTAEAAVKDVSGFCERNPSVCETGKGAFEVFMQKAEFGASMLMGFVESATSGDATSAEAPQTVEPAIAPTPEPAANGTDSSSLAKGASLPWLPAVPASTQAHASQNTLTASDLMPAWKAPARAG